LAPVAPVAPVLPVGVHVNVVYPEGQVPVPFEDARCTVGFDPPGRQNVIDDDEDVAPSANALPATTAPETAAATVQRCLRFKGFMSLAPFDADAIGWEELLGQYQAPAPA